MAVAVAATSWFTDLHAKEGELPAPARGRDNAIAEGDWLAYGRSQMGQRYSPLGDITPANVASLEVAWQFETGDEPQPGDPKETTFEVTPLKIGDRLYLCSPHQNVIALDATTGAEIWRYDPGHPGRTRAPAPHLPRLSYQSALPPPGPWAMKPAPRRRPPLRPARARRRAPPPGFRREAA